MGDEAAQPAKAPESGRPRDSYAPPHRGPRIIGSRRKTGSERIFEERYKSDYGMESVFFLARQIGADDPLGKRESEARHVMTRALRMLRDEAKNHAEGWRPGDSIIERALRTGYREYHGNSPMSGELFYVFDHFKCLIEDEAEELGVAGKLSRKKAAARERLGSPEAFARRALRAVELAGRAGVIAQEMPDGAEGAEGAIDLATEAEALAAKLKGLGGDTNSIARSLKRREALEDAMVAMERIEAIEDDISLAYLRSGAGENSRLAGSMIGERAPEIDRWFAENGALLRADRASVQGALENYVALWLAENQGRPAGRIGFSSRSLRGAAASLRSSLMGPDELGRTSDALKRLVWELARGVPGDDGEETTSSSMDYGQFAQSVGKGIVDSAQRFRESIIDGTAEGAPVSEEERRKAADAFHGLFMQYAIGAAAAHPGRELRDALIENGLEPEITNSIYRNPALAAAFGTAAIEMLSRFFSKDVSARPSPPIEALVPASLAPDAAPAQAPADGEYVEYSDGMAMRDFVRRMPFTVTKALAAKFKEATGYPIDRFLLWGSRRAHSGEMSEAMWSFLINAAADEGGLRDLVRSYPPEGQSREEWFDKVAAMGTFEELAAFAANNKPARSNSSDWERYVEHCEKTGMPEEITVEPRTKVALRAVIPALAFLKEEAAKYGMAVDVWDYLAAIYPAARRMRQSAKDGEIIIKVPSFMARTAFQNWSLESWARRISAENLIINVVKSTVERHSGGHVELAERWNMRKYTKPLANTDPELERMLTDFGEFLRFVRVLDSSGLIADKSGNRLSYAQEPVQSRFAARIEFDHSTYLKADKPYFPDDERLFTEAKRGIYRSALEIAGEFIGNLKLLPRNTAIKKADGTEVTAEDLVRELAEYARRESYYRWSLRHNDSIPYASDDYRKEIREFFSELRRWTRGIVYNSNIQGTIFTGHGPTRFVAASRLEGHRAGFERSALPVLYFDDLMEARKRFGWDAKRIEDLIAIRILAHTAISWGDLERSKIRNTAALEDAVRKAWTGDAASLRRAAADYSRLEKEPLGYNFEGAEAGLRILRRSNGAHAVRRPILAGALPSVSWKEQWRRHAVDMGLCPQATDLAVAAMERYFARGKNLNVYSEDDLSAAVEAELASSGWTMPGMGAEETAGCLVIHIGFFLPTLGVAGESDAAAPAENGDRPEMMAARQVAQRYMAPFPQMVRRGLNVKTRVPILEDRLLQLATLAALEDKDGHLSPQRVFIAARAIIDEYNSSAGEQSPLSSVADVRIDGSGLAGERLASFAASRAAGAGGVNLTAVRHAYFRLYDDFMKGREIDGQRMTEALTASAEGSPVSEEEMTLLAEFIEHQRQAMMSWRAVVRDPRSGLVAHLRQNYSFQDARVDVTIFESFALRLADARIASAAGAEPVEISSGLAAQTLAADIAAKNQLAAFMRSTLSSWMQVSASRIGEHLDLVNMEMAELAGSTGEVPPSGRALLERAADRLGIPGAEAVLADERTLFLLDEIRGTKSREEPLLKSAQRLKAAAEERIAAERRQRREIELTAAEDTIAETAGTAGGFAWRMAEVLSTWQAMKPPSEQDYDSLNRMAHSIDSEVARLKPIGESFQPLEAAIRSAQSVIDGYGAHDENPSLALSLLETGRDLLWRSTSLLAEAFDEAVLIMDRMESARKLAEANRERLAFERRLSGELANVDRIISELDPLISSETILEGEAQKIMDASGRISSLFSGDGPIDPSTFADAAEQAHRHAESAEAMGTGSGEIISRIEALIGGAGTTPPRIKEALAGLEEIASSANEDQFDEIDAAMKSLAEKAAGARRTLAQISATIGRIAEETARMKAILIGAESRLPVSMLAAMPDPLEVEGKGIEERIHEFNRGESRNDPFRRHGRAIRDLADSAMVLSLGDASHLLSRREAASVEQWLRGPRDTSLTLQDAFGANVRIDKGLMGARLVAAADLPEGHPFATMIENLRMAISGNTNEALLISLLARPVARALLSDLLVALSGIRCKDEETALKMVRIWALSQRESISATLDERRAQRFFAVSRTGVRDPDYTEEVHRGLAIAYWNVVRKPQLGELRVKGTRRKQFFNVDVERVRARLADRARAEADLLAGRLTIEHYVPESDRWRVVDLRAAGATSLEQLDLDATAIGEDPESIKLHQIMLSIYSDPELMDLGWLFKISESDMPALHRFLTDLIMPLARTKPGRTAPLTLEEAQREAVGAFLSIRDGLLGMPEVERVKESMILEWLNAPLEAKAAGDLAAAALTEEAKKVGYDIEATVRAVEAQLKTNIAVRHTIAKAFLISVWKKLHEDPEYKSILNLTDLYLMAAAKGDRDDIRKAGERIRETYARLRPRILREKKLLQVATGMHSPEIAAPLAAPDEKLRATHPETGKVGSSQSWGLVRHLDKEPAGHKPHTAAMITSLRRLVQLFPEFANAAALMIVSHDLICDSTAMAVAGIVADYDSSEEHKRGPAIEAFRERFRAAYAEAAVNVRASIVGKSVGEMSLAMWLTGEESPWETSLGWESYSSEEVELFLDEVEAAAKAAGKRVHGDNGIADASSKKRRRNGGGGANGTGGAAPAGPGSPAGAPGGATQASGATASRASSRTPPPGYARVRMNGLTQGIANPIRVPGLAAGSAAFAGARTMPPTLFMASARAFL